uniref:Sema domain-containing protein n=1 Tax=Anopheles maculatus TaxID=74869 RepID=A0A182T717_9DIPT
MQLLLRLILLRLVGGMLPLDAVLKGKQPPLSSSSTSTSGHGQQQQQHRGQHVHGPTVLDDIVARYSLPNGTSRFTHLTYDPTRRMFYAGATNRVLQLNENLTLLKEAITGPKLDSAQCHAAGCPPDVLDSVQTDNYNKVLLYNRDGD